MSELAEFFLQDCSRASPKMRERLDVLASRPGRPQRWMPKRLIVQGYWVFQYQEIEFLDGRLNLRGANQSGKSVLLVTALPVVLDGNTSPRRLDPFDTRDRTIEYLLLGGEATGPAFSYPERTGYLALEFQHGSTGEFVTIGIGVRASASRTDVEFRGFVIRDGRRIGVDFLLRADEGESPPLTFSQLENVLDAGTGNFLSKDRRDYQNAVNDALFGFDDPEQFGHLIRTLVQLRSPKLNGNTTLDEAERALRDSLPPLDEDLLQQVTSAVTHIADVRESVERTSLELGAVEEIDEAYGQFLLQRAQREAVRVRASHEIVSAEDRACREAEDDLVRQRVRLHQLQAEVARVDEDLIAVRGRLRVHEHSDPYRRHIEFMEVARQITDVTDISNQEANRLAGAEQSVAAARCRTGDAEQRWKEEHGNSNRLLGSLYELAAAAAWPIALDLLEAVRDPLFTARVDQDEPLHDVIPSATIESLGTEREAELTQLQERLAKREVAEQRHGELLTLQQARRGERDERERGLRRAEAALTNAKGEMLEQVRVVVQQAQALGVPAGVLDEVGRLSAEYDSASTDPRAMLRPLEKHGREVQARIGDEIDRLRVERAEQVSRGDALEEEYRACSTEPWVAPGPRAGQVDTRKILASQGVRHLPLYAACDFIEGVPAGAAAALESALEEAGLLDALIVDREDRGRLAALLPEIDGSDRWIRGAALTGVPTLADWLRPSTLELAEETAEILKSIGLSEVMGSSTAVSASGEWSIGVIAGFVRDADRVAPRYIGDANRVREREAVLERLRAEIAAIAERMRQADEAARVLSQLRAQVDHDLGRLRDLPGFGRIANAVVERDRAAGDLDTAQSELLKTAREVEGALAVLNSARVDVETVLERIPEVRGRTREGVGGLIEATRRLVEQAEVCRREVGRLDERRKLWADAVADVTREEANLALARSAAVHLRTNLAALCARREELEALLGQHAADVAGLLTEVEGLHAAAADLEVIKESLTGDIGGARTEIATTSTRLEDSQRKRGSCAADYEARSRELERRIRADAHGLLKAAEQRLGSAGALAAAEELLRLRKTAGADLEEAVEDSVSHARVALERLLMKHEVLLAPYRPDLSDSTGLLRLHHDGGPARPAELINVLRVELDRDSRILHRKEDKLYSEFFLNDVALRIRERIDDATAMIGRINDQLSETPISSEGEKVSVKWIAKQRAPDQPNPLDYGRLIELIQADPAFLPSDEVDWVTNFFRRRIAELMKKEESGDLETSFADAMRAVLDYRDWFSFALFVQLPKRPPQQLLKQQFGRRSGAGRALVIFLPLLMSVHVRLGEARSDAPKFIGLDEAFAGVDTANIHRMLDLLVALDFSWIMTNQDLWGIAPRLPGCTTYEIILKGDVVTPILYVWDGRRCYGAVESALGHVPPLPVA